MPKEQTELEKRHMPRLSSKESNQLSRECMQTAMIQLLAEKELQKISVTELVKRAGVSRATFYRNYSTKDDLMSEIIDDTIRKINSFFGSVGTMDDAHQWYLEMFHTVKENEGLARNLFSIKISVAMVFSLGPLMENGEDNEDVRRHYLTRAFEGAFINIVQDWVRNGMQQSPEEMANICMGILPQDLFATSRESGATL